MPHRPTVRCISVNVWNINFNFRFGSHAIYAEIAEGIFLRDGHLDKDDGGDQGANRLQEEEEEEEGGGGEGEDCQGEEEEPLEEARL